MASELIKDLAALLSRELLLSVPRDEFSALREAADALQRAAEVLKEDTPASVTNFLVEYTKFNQKAG